MIREWTWRTHSCVLSRESSRLFLIRAIACATTAAAELFLRGTLSGRRRLLANEGLARWENGCGQAAIIDRHHDVGILFRVFHQIHFHVVHPGIEMDLIRDCHFGSR